MTMVKAGNRVLKHTMYLIVLTAIRTNTTWRVLYRRLVPINQNEKVQRPYEGHR